ncbi:NADH-quinone oxidoreductase subunit L [Anaplasmataceae bacterium AB001_6]|nr:NADH-quinone oxidoreductase subunit L [Anaplasmataceae bacterium AB001_6]
MYLSRVLSRDESENKLFINEYCCSAIIAFSALASCYLLFHHTEPYVIILAKWFSVGLLDVNWSIYIDNVTLLMFVVINSVAAFIHFYSVGYMAKDEGIKIFFIYLSLFVFFMLVLVSAGDLLQLFCGWEGVGFASYLLIGFWYKKESACRASVKAFIVNRVGDLFLLIGIIIVFAVFRSVDFVDIFGNIKAVDNVFQYHYGILEIAGFFLFIGCMGKSAQIGLHVWLPDAMEGPTPVSGLIHSATMVTAGVFLVIRMSPFFDLLPNVKMFILFVGSITALFASTIAIAQDDIKRVIAYSTCSQLGYMFVALGLSAYNAALFHLFTHAFFKSLLFMCAGNVITSLHHEQDMRKMGNVGKVMKLTYAVQIVGSLSLAGIFPFSGFFSKDLIIEYSFLYPVVFFVVLFAAFLTALYSWRLILMIFTQNPVSDASKNVTVIPKVMNIVIFLLSFLAIAAGFIGKYWIGITEQEFWINLVGIKEAPHLHAWMVLPLLVSLLGISVAYLFRNMFLRQDNIVSVILKNKYYFDEVYNFIFVCGYELLSLLSRYFDVKVIDDAVNSVGCIVNKVSSTVSVHVNRGSLHRYIIYMILGAIISIVGIFYFLSFA